MMPFGQKIKVKNSEEIFLFSLAKNNLEVLPQTPPGRMIPSRTTAIVST